MLTRLITNQPDSHWPPFSINTLSGASSAVFPDTQLSARLCSLLHLLITEMTFDQRSCVTTQMWQDCVTTEGVVSVAAILYSWREKIIQIVFNRRDVAVFSLSGAEQRCVLFCISSGHPADYGRQLRLHLDCSGCSSTPSPRKQYEEIMSQCASLHFPQLSPDSNSTQWGRFDLDCMHLHTVAMKLQR